MVYLIDISENTAQRILFKRNGKELTDMPPSVLCYFWDKAGKKQLP